MTAVAPPMTGTICTEDVYKRQTQSGVKPPTFVFFVNEPELMHFSYERFLENKIRENFGFDGTPIRSRCV